MTVLFVCFLLAEFARALLSTWVRKFGYLFWFWQNPSVRTYVCKYAHPFFLADVKLWNVILADSPRHVILPVLKLGIGHPCSGQLTAIKKGYPRAPLWPWLNLCIIYSNIKSVLLNQDVSKRVDELFPIISFVSCRNSTSYGIVWRPFHAESDSGLAATAVVLVVSKDTDSCFGRITFSAANSIKPFPIAVAL